MNFQWNWLKSNSFWWLGMSISVSQWLSYTLCNPSLEFPNKWNITEFKSKNPCCWIQLNLLLGGVTVSQQLPARQALLSAAEPRLTASKGPCSNLARRSFKSMFLSARLTESPILMHFIAFHETYFCSSLFLFKCV